MIKVFFDINVCIQNKIIFEKYFFSFSPDLRFWLYFASVYLKIATRLRCELRVAHGSFVQKKEGNKALIYFVLRLDAIRLCSFIYMHFALFYFNLALA